MKELKLYYFDGCPFCQKVIRYIKDNGIEVQMMDVQASLQNLKELLDTGGKDQVPMLSIDGKALYESDDIIQWFKENK